MSGSPNQRRVLITDAMEWRRLYEQEARSLSQIAALYGRPIVTVHRTLKQQGVHMRPPGRNLYRHPNAIPDEQIEEAASLYKQGLSIEEVAVALGLTKSAARYRLSMAGVMRSHSEALRRSARVRRLAPELEDAIIERYLAGGTCVSVSRELGVGHGSVSAVLARRGVPARRVKVQTLPRAQAPKPKPVDLERVGFVASAPLAAGIAKVAATAGQAIEDVCELAGTTARQADRWRGAVYPMARFDVADRVLTGLDFLWWEVYDPQAYGPGVFNDRQRDDVLAWLDAVDDAARMWTGEPAFSDTPTERKPDLAAAA